MPVKRLPMSNRPIFSSFKDFIVDSSKTISIEFSESAVIDGHIISGKVYYTKKEISLFFGFARNWAGRLMTGKGKAGKFFLEQTASDPSFQKQSELAGGEGETDVLISGEVFDVLSIAAVMSGSPIAASLLAASFSEVRIDREREAMSLPPLRRIEKKESFQEHLDRFYKWYASTLTSDDWKNGDRYILNEAPTTDDIKALTAAVEHYYPTTYQVAPKLYSRDGGTDLEALLMDYD